MELEKFNISIKKGLENAITNNSNMTINNLNISNESYRINAFINNTGTLNLNDSTIDASKYYLDCSINNSGTLNINDGNYMIYDGSLLNNTGKLNINGGNFIFTGHYREHLNYYRYEYGFIYNSSPYDVTINSINISVSDSAVSGYVLYNENNDGNINLTNITGGGTISNNSNKGVFTIVDSNFAGTVKNNGAALLEIKNLQNISIENPNEGNVNIKIFNSGDNTRIYRTTSYFI